MSTDAVLPYAGTSGWSGSETSRARAEHEDTTGITGERQRRALHLIAGAQFGGLTVQELREQTGWHHGQASSALTSLHKAGAIQRLSEVRNRCKVYVSTPHVNGRETEAPGSQRGRVREHYPRRGDMVEAWLKDARDSHANPSREWEVLDSMLDQYRLDADTGSQLGHGREH